VSLPLRRRGRALEAEWTSAAGAAPYSARVEDPRFVAALTAPDDLSAALWFAFCDDELLVVGDGPATVPSGAVPPGEVLRTRYLGAFAGRPCFAVEIAPAQVPTGMRFAGLRALYGRFDPELFELAGLAFQIQHWDRRYQHCPQCRGPLSAKPRERAKRCQSCAADFFPPVTPATITLVHDGSRVLMTRQAHFPPGMFGLVAGFVEPGETLEACVRREVREETALEVDEVRYFGSQPWPFPHQLMIGFFARYAGGELQVDATELEHAQWFDVSELPRLPPKISIARALLDAWLAAR
jgi:NAD+ diphosphatase